MDTSLNFGSLVSFKKLAEELTKFFKFDLADDQAEERNAMNERQEAERDEERNRLADEAESARDEATQSEEDARSKRNEAEEAENQSSGL